MATEQSGSGQFEPPDTTSSYHSASSTSLQSGSDYGMSRLFDSEEGWDLEFVPKRDQKYDCPICLLVLREPIQTECGHRFCRACILKWLRESDARCPIDNMHLEESLLFPDNFAKREILALNVKCPNQTKGCDQILVLKHVQDHLEETCDFSLKPCPLSCANILIRRDLENHLKFKCPKRVVKCPQCNSEMKAEQIQSHAGACPLNKVHCPSCGAEMRRQQLVQHIGSECPDVIVSCQYHFLGCSFKAPRSKIAAHEIEQMQHHMSLLNRGLVTILQRMNIGPMEQTIPSVHSPSSLGYQQTEISAHTSIAEGLSTTASSFPSGDLMQLFQQMNFSQSEAVPISSASLEQVASQNVPEMKLVESSMVETSSSESTAITRNPSTQTREASELSYTSQPSNRNNERAPMSFINDSQYQSFKSQNDLQDESLARHDQHILELTQRYDHHDKLYKDLKMRIKVMENAISEFEGRCGNGIFQWKIKNYRKLRREAEKGETTAIHSVPFYSGFYGYRMCIRVNLNGVDTAKGTHMSVFIHFMQGEYDEQLDWPFSGRIVLTVMDQNPICEVRRHVSETLLSKPNLAAFQKPVNPRNHKGFGYMEFLPLSTMDSSTYVRNDTLIIRANVVSSASS